MLFVPLLEILIAQCLRPAVNRIAFWLGTRVLGGEGQGRILDDHGALGAVEADELAAVVVQVATDGDAEVGIVVESFDEIGEFAAVLEVVEAPAGLRALRGFVGAGDEVNAGNQVDEEIAAEAFAVVGKAAPTEEADGIEGVLGSADQERVPVNRLFAGVGRYGINPGAAG